MPENEILAEIRATREAIARENDYDVATHFAHFRDGTAKMESQGCRVAAPGAGVSDNVPKEADVSCVLREEPPARYSRICGIQRNFGSDPVSPT